MATVSFHKISHYISVWQWLLLKYDLLLLCSFLLLLIVRRPWVSHFTSLRLQFSKVQLLSRVQLFVTPMDCSTPGLPVHHQLPEFTQTHVHWVGDAIQPSYPLSSPSPALNLSQHQGLFQWVSSSHQVVKLLEFQLQHQSFQWIFRIDFLQDWLVWSLCSPRDSQESFPKTTVQKHQFFGAQLSL